MQAIATHTIQPKAKRINDPGIRRATPRYSLQLRVNPPPLPFLLRRQSILLKWSRIDLRLLLERHRILIQLPSDQVRQSENSTLDRSSIPPVLAFPTRLANSLGEGPEFPSGQKKTGLLITGWHPVIREFDRRWDTFITALSDEDDTFLYAPLVGILESLLIDRFEIREIALVVQRLSHYLSLILDLVHIQPQVPFVVSRRREHQKGDGTEPARFDKWPYQETIEIEILSSSLALFCAQAYVHYFRVDVRFPYDANHFIIVKTAQGLLQIGVDTIRRENKLATK